MTKRTLAFAISIFLLAPTIGSKLSLAEGAPPPSTEQVSVHVQDGRTMALSEARSVRESLVIHKNARPTNAFWRELAQCETGNNWTNGGKYAGGLGIYIGTWKRFGGEEFAKSPANATREQQIIIANRIAVDGYQTPDQFKTLDDKLNNKPYYQEPVGLGGWGCYKSKSTGKYRMAKPRMYHASNPFKVPFVDFKYGEKGPLVKDLQTFLRITPDGVYGPKTRKAHAQYLKSRGIQPWIIPSAKTSSQS